MESNAQIKMYSQILITINESFIRKFYRKQMQRFTTINSKYNVNVIDNVL